MSAEAMAYKIGINSRSVEKQIAKLRSMSILSREGADFVLKHKNRALNNTLTEKE